MDGFWWFCIVGVILVIVAMRAMGLGWLVSTMLALIALTIVITLTAVAVIFSTPDPPIP